MIKIDFIKYFSDDEKVKVEDWVSENLQDLSLHTGWNYAVDVTDVVGRTANVDIEIF